MPKHVCFSVTIVRHAETDQNAAHPRILQGHSNPGINSDGIKQSHVVAHRLKNQLFTHIYTSDLLRSKQTAEIIQKHHPHAKLTVDSRLREQDMGDLTGMPWRDAKAVLKSEDRSFEEHLSQNGESVEDFTDRVVDFYSDVVEKHLLIPHHELLESLGLNSPLSAIEGYDAAADPAASLPSPPSSTDSPTSATSAKTRKFRAASIVAGPAINAAKAAAQKAAVAVGLMTSPTRTEANGKASNPSSPTNSNASPTSATPSSYSTAPSSASIKSPINNLKQNQKFGSTPFLSQQQSQQQSQTPPELGSIQNMSLTQQPGFSASTSALNTSRKPRHPRIQPTHILIVTHGGWINRIMDHILDELKFNLTTDYSNGFPKNTGLYRFVISQVFRPDGGDYEWEGTVTLMNDVSHYAHLSNKVSMGSMGFLGLDEKTQIQADWTAPKTDPGRNSPTVNRKKAMAAAPSKNRSFGW
ncbi:hypothetical protein SmJEL517_g05462 [Synchytrium microbalum]|uniref:Uncharacterized protein n=1 Tax=Synchytrium microbalum TaxID=1806994 RepID=A0A507C0T3_9FUNG|nr:uncharacterized protein SmJEL517_g05462 [Synchytrium microbalum]TPX31143.1 hypothetical protein SmJEL517_g05462 [Synchytrium microbalum]